MAPARPHRRRRGRHPRGDGRVADGDLSAFDDDEELLLRYALATLRRTVDDDLHEAFVAASDESTAVGVASLANGYASLVGVLDALDVGLEEGEEFSGWDPRE